jgi:hypothetical protein
MARPKPVAFNSEERQLKFRRCKTCRDDEVNEFIRGCIEATREAGEGTRPPFTWLHEQAVKAFGKKRFSQTPGTLAEHLRRHEDLWNEWYQ